MLSGWQTVILTLGAAIISGGIAIVFAQESLRSRRDERNEVADRRRRGLEMSIRLNSIVWEANPERYVMNTTREMLSQLDGFREQLRSIHDPLLVLVAESGDLDLDDAARAALRTTHNRSYRQSGSSTTLFRPRQERLRRAPFRERKRITRKL
jgi:hypothetical protein